MTYLSVYRWRVQYGLLLRTCQLRSRLSLSRKRSISVYRLVWVVEEVMVVVEAF